MAIRLRDRKTTIEGSSPLKVLLAGRNQVLSANKLPAPLSSNVALGFGGSLC
jgi:hypothetical protein